MKLILNQAEINSAFGCRLEELGLANINKSSIVVTFKSTRGAEGSTEAEVDFDFYEPANTKLATQPTANEIVEGNNTEAADLTKDKDAPVTDAPDGDTDTEAGDVNNSSDIADIFN